MRKKVSEHCALFNFCYIALIAKGARSSERMVVNFWEPWSVINMEAAGGVRELGVQLI
jgi:hypothetical protein